MSVVRGYIDADSMFAICQDAPAAATAAARADAAEGAHAVRTGHVGGTMLDVESQHY